MRKDKIEYIDTKRLSKYPKHLVDDLYKWRRIKRDINKKLELRSELYNEIKNINDRLSTLRKQYTSNTIHLKSLVKIIYQYSQYLKTKEKIVGL